MYSTISPIARWNQTSFKPHCRSTILHNEVQNHSGHILAQSPQLWPCGNHRSSCTTITSKQKAEESILPKWHLSKRYGFITRLPASPGVVWVSKQQQPRANISYRWIALTSYCCRNSSGPPTGHLKARMGSPCWDTVCCWGPFTLICAGTLPTTARGKGRGRKHSGLTGFLGIKRPESHLVVRDLVLAVMWNLIKKEREASDIAGCLCRAVAPVNQGRRWNVWRREGRKQKVTMPSQEIDT